MPRSHDRLAISRLKDNVFCKNVEASNAFANLDLRAHITVMHTDFSVFRERLAEACRVRSMSHSALCRGIGLSPKKALEIEYYPLKTLDLYRVSQIADKLEVSIDWLLGRTNVMNVAEMPEEPEAPDPQRKKKAASKSSAA